MTEREAIHQLCSNRCSQAALDELVYDGHEEAACRLNNSGIDKQIDYLTSIGMTTAEIIEKIARGADDDE